MADKKKSADIIVALPRSVAAYAKNLYTPDTEAPAGASFKPDGKYKLTVIFDDVEDLADVRAQIEAAAKAKWPNVDFEDFKFPWVEHDEDSKREDWRGKTTITARSKFKPVVVDAKRKELGDKVKVFGGDVVKIAVKLYLYEKTEKVKEGKKVVDVMIRGCALQLFKVQLLEKRSTGGGPDPFGDEDGFEATDEDSDTDDKTEGGGASDDDGDF